MAFLVPITGIIKLSTRYFSFLCLDREERSSITSRNSFKSTDVLTAVDNMLLSSHESALAFASR